MTEIQPKASGGVPAGGKGKKGGTPLYASEERRDEGGFFSFVEEGYLFACGKGMTEKPPEKVS